MKKFICVACGWMGYHPAMRWGQPNALTVDEVWNRGFIGMGFILGLFVGLVVAGGANGNRSVGDGCAIIPQPIMPKPPRE